MNKNKRPQAKCPPTFEISVCGECVYNMYVLNNVLRFYNHFNRIIFLIFLNVGRNDLWKKVLSKLFKLNALSMTSQCMTSIKYNHLQVMVTITGKFYQQPLRNVGVVETRTFC